jgi:hypothetical protein
MIRRPWCVLFPIVLLTSPASAQDHQPDGHESTHQHQAQEAGHGHDPQTDDGGWSTTLDANVFFGRNFQIRHFADVFAWESQNWLMFDAGRRLGAGRLTLASMFSLEPFTMAGQGSPQLFQTGETYHGIPLVNYQHPHDLFMELGATYTLDRGTTRFIVGADVVGDPTLGPTPFMHRASAQSNPQVPLTHHFLDSTHSTPGVVRGGVEVGDFTFEGSVFRGREPDENRLDIEAPALDSWAGRVRWRRGGWEAQFSAGHLHLPEWYEPYDITRLTASISYEGTIASRPLAVTLAWGENQQFNGFNGTSDGFLLEWDVKVASRSTFYGRTEAAAKDLFNLGFHPVGDRHPHWFTPLGAVTGGYLFDFHEGRFGRVGVGADATLYWMTPDIKVYWENSRSYHVFVHWRPFGTQAHHH